MGAVGAVGVEDKEGLPLRVFPEGSGVREGVGDLVGLARLEEEKEGDLEIEAVTEGEAPVDKVAVGVPVGVRGGEGVGESEVGGEGEAVGEPVGGRVGGRVSAGVREGEREGEASGSVSVRGELQPSLLHSTRFDIVAKERCGKRTPRRFVAPSTIGELPPVALE